MSKVFEKIIEKLEERTSFLSDCTKYGNKDAEQQNKSYSTMMMYEVADLVDDLIEIVKQEAEQYNNKKTNADRIRSMNYEEMAEFLKDVKADYQWTNPDYPSEDDSGAWVDWLQSEVEE